MTEINWQEAINRYVNAQQEEFKRPPSNQFRASSLGGCVRQCVRRRVGISKLNNKTLRTFEVGTILHRFIQQELALGHIGTRVEFEKPVEFEYDGIKFTGHVDCYTGSEIYDFKSHANVEWAKKYPTNPGYILQLSIYCHALQTVQATLVYFDKRDLSVFEKKIEPLHITKVVEFCKEVMVAEKEYDNSGQLPEKDDCYACEKEDDENAN